MFIRIRKIITAMITVNFMFGRYVTSISASAATTNLEKNGLNLSVLFYFSAVFLTNSL
ncbi:MAG: hypothetical protein K0R54_4553 [Clostridiaceae bacterium]|jgi:hypothetical protein|nr:hypothetical protein [Clostridiaceae bacterium]